MNEKKLYVVMEIGSADLSQIVKDLSINFKAMPPSYLILFYWMEMLRAVQQIHEDGIYKHVAVYLSIFKFFNIFCIIIWFLTDSK